MCGCLLVDFGAGDGTGDVVYVGTGEIRPSGSGTPGAKLGGVGVLRLSEPLPAALAAPFGNPWKREATNLAAAGIFRLAWNPTNHDEIVAATSMGLFKRVGPFEEDKPWIKITSGPFDFDAEDDQFITDVAWTAAPVRLWVALQDNTLFSNTNVWMSNNASNGPFHEISLSKVDNNGRLGLAVSESDPSILYVLGRGPRLWRISGTTARPDRERAEAPLRRGEGSVVVRPGDCGTSD